MVGPVLGVAVTDDLKLCVKVFRTRKNLSFPAHPGLSELCFACRGLGRRPLCIDLAGARASRFSSFLFSLFMFVVLCFLGHLLSQPSLFGFAFVQKHTFKN